MPAKNYVVVRSGDKISDRFYVAVFIPRKKELVLGLNVNGDGAEVYLPDIHYTSSPLFITSIPLKSGDTTVRNILQSTPALQDFTATPLAVARTAAAIMQAVEAMRQIVAGTVPHIGSAVRIISHSSAWKGQAGVVERISGASPRPYFVRLAPGIILPYSDKDIKVL